MYKKPIKLLEGNARERISSISTAAISVEMFYQHEKKWTAMDGSELSDKDRRVALDHARRAKNGTYKPTSKPKLYIFVEKYNAGVEITFSKSIQKNGQESAKLAFDRIVADSDNEFGATHDRHTGLPNRATFDRLLSEITDGLGSDSGVPMAVDEDVVARPPLVALVSIDIDHFKTINDRFGHGYGDVVLAAFSWRLEEAISQGAKERSNKVSAQLFRLGGEEFQVLIQGAIGEDDLLEFVDGLRQRIANSVLPSEKEANGLRDREFAGGVTLPHDAYRKVTASFGVAVATREERSSVRDVCSKLKKQADTALTSAKNGGRDQVRMFSDILKAHGRIVSVDAKNGVIAIDVGKDVGVRKGQEFYVYPPLYDGRTPFDYGEGRSKKQIGVYPKFKAATIVAFEVQNEVSFCRAVKKEAGVEEVLALSKLEAIPLGSVTHLVSEIGGAIQFWDQGSIRTKLNYFLDDESFLVVAVSIDNLEEVSEVSGLARANECLVTVGLELSSEFGSSATYGHPTTDSIVVVVKVKSEKAGFEDQMKALHEKISTRLGSDVKFGIGWLEKMEGKQLVDLPKLSDVSGMVDAAVLASKARGATNDVRRFSYRVVANAMSSAIQTQNKERAFADYQLFTGFGLSHAAVENQYGFFNHTFNFGDVEMAESAFRRAVTLRGSNAVIEGNLACFLIVSGKYDEGFQLSKEEAFPKQYRVCRLFGALKVLNAEEFARFANSDPAAVSKALEDDDNWLSDPQLEELRRALEARASYVA